VKTMQQQQEWIVAHMGLLAAIAWRGYQSKGRGVVHIVIDESLKPPVGGPPGPALGLLVGYRATAEFPDHETDTTGPRGMCARYDPEEQIVVVVAWQDDDGMTNVNHHRLRTIPSPPDAYKQYKKRLDDKCLQESTWAN